MIYRVHGAEFLPSTVAQWTAAYEIERLSCFLLGEAIAVFCARDSKGIIFLRATPSFHSASSSRVMFDPKILNSLTLILTVVHIFNTIHIQTKGESKPISFNLQSPLRFSTGRFGTSKKKQCNPS